VLKDFVKQTAPPLSIEQLLFEWSRLGFHPQS